jgi:thymidylate synthase
LEPNTQEFYGAYGVRIGSQLNDVVRKLSHDRDTRQAVITLWSPELDNRPGHRDYPCTVMLHAAIIDDKLELTTTMRSQDIWLGTPFDVFQFTQLQQTVARACNVTPGTYRHITLSTHLYETNLPDVDRLTRDVKDEWQPAGIGRPGDSVGVVQVRALGLASPSLPFNDPTDSEMWYCAQLSTLV